MAPNSFVKATPICSLSKPLQKEHDHDEIRTDFVLQNIYSYMIKNSICFDAIRANNAEEEELMFELKQIIDEFKCRNSEKIRVLCAQLEISVDTLGSTLLGISNELFVEGITWSRIIALFVFVGLLTIQCIENNMSENVVHSMYGCFCRLVKESLKPWIDDHGGWSGVLSLKKDRPVGWTKNLFRSTVSVIGTLAHLSNLPC